MIQLSNENFIIQAMKNYDKVSVIAVTEFEADLERFRYLNKLINRYKNNNDLKIRMILNHIIVLYNVFGNFATQALMFRIPDENWDSLLPFLIYLNRLDPSMDISNIVLDTEIVNQLRAL